MALASAIVWEVRTTGLATNGGGFKAGASGTDHTKQDAAQYSVTDGVTAGTTTITSATASFGTDVVGNVMYVQGGTGGVVAGWYEITARASASSITVDRSTGLTAGTGVTLKIGGGFIKLADVTPIAVASNTCYVKAGTYSTGTQIDTGATWSNYTIEGYNTTRGDGLTTTRPVLQATAAITLLKARNNGAGTLRHLDIDGNAATGTNGVLQSNQAGNSTLLLDNCAVHNFSASGVYVDITITYVTQLRRTEIYSCNYGLGDNSVGMIVNAVGCIFRNCTQDGTRRAQGMFVDCLAYENGANGFENGQNYATTYVNCTSYGNTGSGFGSAVGNTRRSVYINCLSYGNTAWGFNQTSSDIAMAYYCATGTNTSGAYTNVTQVIGNVALTADPFTAKASDDYSLNTTSGGGAACRAAGFLGTFPGSLSTGYRDIGAVQHQDPSGGGGSGMLFIPNMAGT